MREIAAAPAAELSRGRLEVKREPVPTELVRLRLRARAHHVDLLARRCPQLEQSVAQQLLWQNTAQHVDVESRGPHGRGPRS